MNPQLPAEVHALRNSHNRLSGLVSGLDAEGIRQPSYASEWSIAQVLSHLGSQAVITGRTLEAGLSGGDPPGRDDMEPIWDEWNAKAPEAQVRDSLDRTGALLDRLEAIGPDQIENFQVKLFLGDVDLAAFTRLLLTEHALHTWDVAVMSDPAATLAADAVGPVLGQVEVMAGFAGKPASRPFRVRAIIADPERDYLLSVTDPVSLERYDGAGPVDGTVELPAEPFIRLVYGRLDPEHTPEVRESGARGLADLRVAFPGF